LTWVVVLARNAHPSIFRRWRVSVAVIEASNRQTRRCGGANMYLQCIDEQSQKTLG
jgi:hypothetical protein